eukprot:6638197-Alexandrium_andersonii.AAC.1
MKRQTPDLRGTSRPLPGGPRTDPPRPSQMRRQPEPPHRGTQQKAAHQHYQESSACLPQPAE